MELVVFLVQLVELLKLNFCFQVGCGSTDLYHSTWEVLTQKHLFIYTFIYLWYMLVYGRGVHLLMNVLVETRD